MRHRLTYLFAISTAAVGCGDDGVKHLADAPPSGHDAAVDAPPDAPPGPVTITVVSAMAPQAGVKVYFQGPDSTEILSTTTDATGTASALMPNGGFVTALNPFPPPPAQPTLLADGDLLKTFANVKPGDHLVLNDTTIQPTFKVLQVALPVDADSPNNYDVYTDCGIAHQYIPQFGTYFGSGSISVGNGSGSATDKVNPIISRNLVSASAGTASIPTLNCDTTGKANFVVITEDPETGDPLNVAYVTQVDLDADVIDLTAGTFAGPVDSYEFDFANGTTLDGIELDLNFLGTGGEIGTAADSTSNDTGLTAGAGNTTISIPTIAGTMPVAHMFFEPTASSQGDLEGYQWGLQPSVDKKVAIDLTGRALLDYAASPTYDQPTHAVSWTTNAGAMPNAYFLETEFFRGDAEASWTWDIVGTFSGATIAYPVLPSTAVDYNATADDEADINNVIVAAIPGGYDFVKPHAYDVIKPGADLTPAALGASGHFETNAYFPDLGKMVSRTKTPNQLIRAMAKATRPATMMRAAVVKAHKRH